jgi:hypothetical protein
MNPGHQFLRGTSIDTPADTVLDTDPFGAFLNSADEGAERCILMFSGGRDSTLASLRLQEEGHRLVLVTVTSSHLVGISRVRQRLGELGRLVDPETPWIQVRQPEHLCTDTSFYKRTCLPCHHAYVVVSAILAKQAGAKKLAFGYAGYQQTWPEQTPLAVSRLRAVLRRHGMDLLLPVYDLPTRDAAITLLQSYGLSADALEQKCTRQVSNVALSDASLHQQIDLWERAIEESLTSMSRVRFEILDSCTIGRA